MNRHRQKTRIYISTTFLPSKKRRTSRQNIFIEAIGSMGKEEVEEDDTRTSGVSRGVSEKEAKKRHNILKHTKRSSSDKALITKYDADAQQGDRISRLENDTAVSKKLSAYQKRALDQRIHRKDKVVKAKLQVYKTKRYEAAIAAADAQVVLHTENAGLLEAEHDMERTTALSQVELKRSHLDEQTARQIYDLTLPYAPYGCKYDRSGRYSVLYGQRGHVSIMDAHHLSLHTEFHVQERVRDACFLHNFSMLAVAQTNHVYIYDDTGAEIHKLNDHHDPFAIDFLPYHWLLASIGRPGYLKFQDTSTGQLVSQHKTKLGPCQVLRQNPSNAVMHCGHSNGTVTLWSPGSSQYLAKMLCHKGAPITSLAVDLSGKYMVTGGADRQVKVWDLRTYQSTHSYFVPAGVPASLDISQRGVVGIGHAGHATFWSPEALTKKVKDPYMHHAIPACGPVETLRFRPFEDVCGIGHAKGVSSIVVPGSGEPNLDTTEYNLNPFQDKNQRREAEVRALLDKLDPNMITLDPNEIGGMEESTPEIRQERLKDMQEEANAKKKEKKEKNKKRGRSKIKSKLGRKQRNVVDEQIVKLREAREKEKAEQRSEPEEPAPKETAPAALKRFF
jgi:U3 small nucleolar RNA-associated protein 7